MGLHPQAILSVMLLVLDLLRRGYRVAISTHSPLVLAGAKDAHVLALDGENVYPLQHVYGQDSNTVLSDYMNGPTRAAEVQAQLDEAAGLIDQDRLPDAQRSIAALETRLGTNNTELVRLRTALEFLHPPGPRPTKDSEQK